MPTAAGLYYYEHGDGGQERKATLLLHGAGGVLEQWPHQLRRLPGRKVLAPDLPGHGRSGGSACNSIEDYVKECVDWLDSIEVAEVAVLGHSLGGAIALSLALEKPALVTRMVLLGAAARMPVNSQLLDLLAVPLKVQAGVNKIISWSFAKHSDDSLRGILFSQLMANRAGVLNRDFQACSNFDVRGRLDEIRIPTLLIAGSEDRMLFPALSEETTNAISGAKLKLIEGAGHMLMQEKPGELREAVEEFLHN